MRKECSDCICLQTGSVFKIGKNYYEKVFLEECKYIIIEKR